MSARDFILTLSCTDTTGIVYNVSGFLFERGCNIIDSAQFGDQSTGLFFLRVHFSMSGADGLDELRAGFAPVAKAFDMQWALFERAVKPRLLLMVSRHGHCLNDLLFRWKSGQLHCEIPAIVSNHNDFAGLAASYGIPFYHLPVTAETRDRQELRVQQIMAGERIDLVVLARYMQVLSDTFCRPLVGRIINIHHSFLPSFKGAEPYRQAHERGVKLIGATAHYVTPALDEGPIIEQDVARVTHAMGIAALTALGRDIESLVLSRAVRWHCEHRILLNSDKTVVF
jgi:formyltetrahydrofolate deformylase